jgi:hypothetical protein
MASGIEKFFFALGKGVKAAKASAAARQAAEPPPGPAPDPNPQPPATIELVRCPRCGAYAPAGRPCTCTP